MLVVNYYHYVMHVICRMNSYQPEESLTLVACNNHAFYLLSPVQTSKFSLTGYLFLCMRNLIISFLDNFYETA